MSKPAEPTPPAPARKRKPAQRTHEPAAETAAGHAVVNVPAPEAAPSARLIRVAMPVRWRDLDAFNHVNNSKYLSYLEEARLQWLLALPGKGMDEHVAPVVAAAHLNYRRPIEWPNDVAIELFVERLGNTSVSIGHRIVAATNPDITYCDGNIVLVWIDRDSGTSAPLPDAVREACSPA